MADLLERQQFTPEGQELPAWLSYQAVTTTIDGIAVTTGTILELPLTYYGPSIPLGPDWVYGGETSPAVTASASAPETSSPTPIATPSSADAPAPSPTASSAVASNAASSSIPYSSSTSGSSIIPTTTSSTFTSPSSSPSASPSSISLVASTNSASSSSSTTIPSFTPTTTSTAPSAPAIDSDRRTTLLVLLPSVLGPLLLALLILLLCFCLVRRKQNTYTRAPTSDPSGPIAAPIPVRRASTNRKLPFTPPRTKPTGAGTVTEKVPLLSTKDIIGTVRPRPTAEPEEEDITDFANPHRSSILSRLSLGLGIAPTMRVFSGGGAENAYRTPSWALAGLARRISSGFRSTSRAASAPIVVEKPAGDSRGQSTIQPSSGNDDTTTEPQSAGYARTMGDDELFYRPPGSTGSGEAGRGSRSSRVTGSSGSRSTRGTGPSNWQSAFPVLEEDDPHPPSYATPARAGHQRGMGNTVSVGVPETPRTGAGSIGSASFLGMEAGERDRRSRWVEEGERMEFPVPPGMYGGSEGGMGSEGMGAVGNRGSVISSAASGNTNYYSANSHPDTPPAYNAANEPSTIRLVQPLTDDTTLRGHTRPILSSRLSSSQRGSDNTRRSFVGEPLLGPPSELAEFGQLRTVSGGQMNTLISAPHNSNARSSHYASVHISDSSRSVYSQVSSESAEREQSLGGGTENLAEVGSTFGVVSDRALRGRRSHATLVSARSVRLGQTGQRDEGVGRGGPAVPSRNPARPPPLPRLSSERTVDGRLASKEGATGAGAEKKRSWLGWKKDRT